MTTGYIENSGDLFKRIDKLIYQNKAEIVDCYEGCLLDNLLYQAKNGMFALYETYVNPWVSKYTFKFARTEQEQAELWDEFVDRRNIAEQEVEG